MCDRYGAPTLGVFAASLIATAWPSLAAIGGYPDGRPAAVLRMDAKDHGIVLRHGDGPDRCDVLGARDVWVFPGGDSISHIRRNIGLAWLDLPLVPPQPAER